MSFAIEGRDLKRHYQVKGKGFFAFRGLRYQSELDHVKEGIGI